ncbi:MAG: hypothetical protein DHS20C11_03740 [Lysobacteraceae bacterium]|nr:MAG: hypothetical protein DHS20C11_03740 [Xanthomonadaceae bacterium]
MSTTSLPSQFVLALASLQRVALKRVDRHLNIHGISFTEFIVLRALAAEGDHTLRRIDLAEEVGLSASGITRVLAPMAKIGLIKKELNPRDARVSLVKLTAAGRSIFEDASRTFEQGAQALTSSLDSRQMKAVTEAVALVGR